MKGYKAFGKGMICRGKQYAENTVFKEESAEICKSGMHFCENPLDVLEYYPLVDKNGVEIYEGDIVRTEKGRVCKVVWFSSNAHCGFDLFPLEDKNPAPSASTIWKIANIEAIGNIYDNPELLEIEE